MTKIFSQRTINPYAFTADNEVSPYLVVMDCTSTSASAFTYALKAKVRVIDAWAIPIASNTSATITVQDNDANDISDAIVIAVDKTIGRVGTIDDANWDEVKGNNIIAQQNAIADSCWLFIVVVPMNA